VAEFTLVFWISILYDLVVLVFGSIHYRIDRDTDRVYSVLLLIGIVTTVVSGVGWILTRGT